MTFRFVVFLCTGIVLRSAAAIDIPMDRSLATEALDSKTCYSTVKSNGQLIGYELNDLLVSSSGKLVRLKATGTFVVGERKPRRYMGHGIEVTIVPQRMMRHDDDNEDLSIVLEEGSAVVSDHGRRQRLQVKVSEICTP